VQSCPVCQLWRADNPLIRPEALDFAAIGEALGAHPREAGGVGGGARAGLPSSARSERLPSDECTRWVPTWVTFTP